MQRFDGSTVVGGVFGRFVWISPAFGRASSASAWSQSLDAHRACRPLASARCTRTSFHSRSGSTSRASKLISAADGATRATPSNTNCRAPSAIHPLQELRQAHVSAVKARCTVRRLAVVRFSASAMDWTAPRTASSVPRWSLRKPISKGSHPWASLSGISPLSRGLALIWQRSRFRLRPRLRWSYPRRLSAAIVLS